MYSRLKHQLSPRLVDAPTGTSRVANIVRQVRLGDMLCRRPVVARVDIRLAVLIALQGLRRRPPFLRLDPVRAVTSQAETTA